MKEKKHKKYGRYIVTKSISPRNVLFDVNVVEFF